MYDPTIPQANTEIEAVQMRSQLNGLKDMIDAVPAGPLAHPDPMVPRDRKARRVPKAKLAR